MPADPEGYVRLDGFVPLLWSEEAGRMLMEIPAQGARMLHLMRVSHGLGEFPIERGMVTRPVLVRFERHGARVALVAENVFWRSSSPEEAERRAIRESFPESVLGVFPVVRTDDRRLLVDATSFFTEDGPAYAAKLGRIGHAGYSLDPARCFILADRSRAFRTSSQVEVRLTFTNPAAVTASVWRDYGRREGMMALAPDPRSVTLGVRHAFLELPEPGFVPREADPRAGYSCSVIYDDFAAAPGTDQTRRLMIRHRLQRRDPAAASGPAVKPIVYYIDRGFPAHLRAAVLEGAGWWAEAFEAAGFTDAFRVELLPEDADPMDFSYNTITWSGRATRAFAWGGTVVDPRTGEIIKGEVTLTALRDRQFQIAAEALARPDIGDRRAAAEEMVQGFFRMLAAHELGHTLGLDHNHAVGDVASVMDYAAPLIEVGPEGCVDLDHSYRKGIGPWDRVSICYGYSECPPGLSAEEERDFLDRIIADSLSAGHVFLGNEDSAPVDSAHPGANYWTRGNDPVAELERMIAVRRAALDAFGPHVLPDHEAMARLEDFLVPVFRLHERYVTAACKTIGGVDYRHARKGDGQTVAPLLDGTRQRRALRAVLATLDAAFLTLPEQLLTELGPRGQDYPRTGESFPSATGSTFDPLAAAASSAVAGLVALLDPRRLNRLVEHQHRKPDLVTLDELFAALIDAGWNRPAASGLEEAVSLTVAQLVLDHVAATVTSAEATALVRAGAAAALGRIGEIAMQQAQNPALATPRRDLAAYALNIIASASLRPPAPSFSAIFPRRPLPGP